MLTLKDLENVKQNLEFVSFREKLPNVFKIILLFFDEDGDMYDIFVEESPDEQKKFRLSDHGSTLMKLSYTLVLDTLREEKICEDIVAQSPCQFDKGNIFLDVFPEQLEYGILKLTQTISKISTLAE